MDYNFYRFRWLCLVTPAQQIDFVDSLYSSGDLSQLFYHWVELFKPHLVKYQLLRREGWPADLLASGFLFFYGCCFYLFCLVSDIIPYIESVVDYTLLYMLVDNYLDSQVLTETAISEMKQVLTDDEFEPTEKYVREIREVYLRLCAKHSQVKARLIDLFSIEVAGLAVQNNSQCSYDQYLKMGLSKGAATFPVVAAFLSEAEIRGIQCSTRIQDLTRDLGAIMQLLDDMLDIEQDQNNQCHTVMTNWITNHDNLDELWWHMLSMIEQLSPPFAIWGWIYSLILVYLPMRNPQYFSEQLRQLANKYNPLAFCNGSEILLSELTHALNSAQ